MSERLKVFISYRRADCMVHAGRPAENLTDRAGAEVFLDIESIPLGMSFPEWIDREIASCDAVLVVIGDDWLALSYEGDPPRIESASDWVRVEIEAALERGVLTIPVLVEGAAMPRPDQLPDSIRGLAHRNAAELRDSSWRADFERIAAAIERSRRQPEPQIESDLRWPGRFSDSWFATNVPRMDAEQLEALRSELHRRNWTDAELAERVLVHANPTQQPPGATPLGADRRSRQPLAGTLLRQLVRHERPSDGRRAARGPPRGASPAQLDRRGARRAGPRSHNGHAWSCRRFGRATRGRRRSG